MTVILDFDAIKAEADSLNISYRSDILPATLQGRIDEAKAQAPTDKAPEPTNTQAAPVFYKNTTLVNIFTSKGKCKPQGLILVNEDEAMQLGLTQC